jgi:hypothetical protein
MTKGTTVTRGKRKARNLQNFTFVNFTVTIFEFGIIHNNSIGGRNLCISWLSDLKRIDSSFCGC